MRLKDKINAKKNCWLKKWTVECEKTQKAFKPTCDFEAVFSAFQNGVGRTYYKHGAF